jgi:hypothetical protein
MVKGPSRCHRLGVGGESCGGGFVDEVEAAIFCHAIGQQLGALEVVERIDSADGISIFIADINNPCGDFFAVLVLVGLWAVEVHGAERADVGKFGCWDTHND